jgi:hypothetical protein
VVKIVELLSDRILYIILRGWWYGTIALNVHAPREDKSEDMKDVFYDELK